MLRQIAEEQPPSPSGVPRDLVIVAAKALQKQPIQRYVSAQALADDLRRWLRGEPILAKSATVFKRVCLWVRRRPAVAASAGIVCLTIFLALAGEVRGRKVIEKALEQSRQHERATAAALGQSMRNEAKLMIDTVESGRRSRVLDLMHKAGPGGDMVENRSLIVTALTLFDVESVRELPPCHVPTLLSCEAATPDLKWLACYQDPKTVVVREAETGLIRCSLSLKQAETVVGLELNRDATYLAITSKDATVKVYDIIRDRTVLEGKTGMDTKRPERCPSLSGFHPVGSRFALSQREGPVRIFDLSDGSFYDLPANTTGAASLAFSPDGHLLAVCLEESNTSRRVEAWDWAGKKLEWGVSTFSAGFQCQLCWDPQSAMLVHHHGGSPKVVEKQGTGASFTALPMTAASGKSFVVDGWGIVVTWGQQLTAACSHEQVGMQWTHTPSRDTSSFLPGAGGLSAIGIDFTGRVTKTNFLPASVFRHYASQSRISNVTVSFLQNQNPLRTFHHGHYLVSPGPGKIAFWRVDHGVSTDIWQLDVENPKDRALPSHQIRLVIAPDERSIFASRQEGIWRREVHIDKDDALQLGPAELMPETDNLTLMGIDPSGKNLVVSANNRALLVPVSGKGEKRPLGPNFEIHQRPRFSPRLTFVYQSAGRVVFRTESGERVFAPPGRGLLNLFFSGDERLAAMDDGGLVRVFHTSDWSEMGAIAQIPTIDPTSRLIAFSPDGRYVAAETAPGTLTLVRLRDFEPVVRLVPRPQLDLAGVIFSDTGDRIFVSAPNATVAEWNIPAIRAELAKRGMDWED